jgi:hypothetical protein
MELQTKCPNCAKVWPLPILDDLLCRSYGGEIYISCDCKTQFVVDIKVKVFLKQNQS